jgi:hypothetical protein
MPQSGHQDRVHLCIQHRQLFPQSRRGGCADGPGQAETDGTVPKRVSQHVSLLLISDLLQQHGIQLRCVGRREMLPLDLQKAIQQMEDMTSQHQKYV